MKRHDPLIPIAAFIVFFVLAVGYSSWRVQLSNELENEIQAGQLKHERETVAMLRKELTECKAGRVNGNRIASGDSQPEIESDTTQNIKYGW